MSITITPSRQRLLYNWFLPKGARDRIDLSSIPFPATQNATLSSIDDSDLADIINSRFDINPLSRISAVFGQPDFLPFSFLELGVKRGAAVCRLVREFSEESRGKIVEALDALENELKTSENSILTKEDIEEIFSLSERESDFIKDFFLETDKNPLDALKDPERFNKLLPIPIATGFLVGSSYLLTNNHVLPDREVCHEVITQFGYDQDGLGRKITPIEYKLDTNDKTGFFETNEALDYTIVKLQDRPKDPKLFTLGRAGDRFGWITLDENKKSIAPTVDIARIKHLQDSNFTLKIPEGKSMQGEPVNIIQHPKGKRKQVILSSNRVIEIYKEFIHYQADTDFSSSGSPVFNQQWQLVALHHAAVANIKDDSTIEIVAEQGVRICAIIKDLKLKQEQYQAEYTKDSPMKQGLDPRAAKIQTFIENFVDTEEKEAENKATIRCS
jgi:V8-like Glu-specific endopeptidase